MNADRRYLCPSCKGLVSVPRARRVITIEQVREAHETSCPGRGTRR